MTVSIRSEHFTECLVCGKYRLRVREKYCDLGILLDDWIEERCLNPKCGYRTTKTMIPSKKEGWN